MTKKEALTIYEAYTAADTHYVGFMVKDKVYAIKLNNIPLDLLFWQDETNGDEGLYVRVTSQKAKRMLLNMGAKEVCSLDELVDKKYNRGVIFEKIICDKLGIDWLGKDARPFYECGDICYNGQEISVKFNHARLCYLSTLESILEEEKAYEVA